MIIRLPTNLARATANGNVTSRPMITDFTGQQAALFRQAGAGATILQLRTDIPASGNFDGIDLIIGGADFAGSGANILGLRLDANVTSGTQTSRIRGMDVRVGTTGSAIASGTGTNALRGGSYVLNHKSTGTMAEGVGFSTNAFVGGNGAAIAAGAVTSFIGNRVEMGYNAGDLPTSGSIITCVGIQINAPAGTSASRTITTNYGIQILDQMATGITTGVALRIENQTSGGYAIQSGNGMVSLGGRFMQAKGANIASANDLTLGAGNVFFITGNTQINTIVTTNWQAGSVITLEFLSNPTVKHNTAGAGAVLFLSGSVDFVAATDSVLTLMYDGTQWQELARKVA